MAMFNNNFSPRFNDVGLKQELSEDIGERVIEHRNRVWRLMYTRYLEMLPVCIQYNNNELTKQVSVNWLKVETLLRDGNPVVIGENKHGTIILFGTITVDNSSQNPASFFKNNKRHTKSDIRFLCDESVIPNSCLEIISDNNCSDGNFIILRNKAVSYSSDYEVIYHYCNQIAEISASRFSLAIQSKIMTFFQGEKDNETLNQVIAKLFNGSPYIKVDEFFDIEESMHTVQNVSLGTNLQELKRENQNYVSELNNMLGINSLAVDKNSGVSDVEAKSNRAFVTTVSNSYILGRQEPLDRLNKRFKNEGLNINCYYDDEAVSELNIKNMDGEENE